MSEKETFLQIDFFTNIPLYALRTVAHHVGVEIKDGNLNLDELFDKTLELGLRDEPRRLIGDRCYRCGEKPSTDGDFCNYCCQRIDWSEE